MNRFPLMSEPSCSVGVSVEVYSEGVYPEAASFAARAAGAFIAAVATPMTPTRHVDKRVLEAYFGGVMERGATGLAAGVHTGRGSELSLDERILVVDTARSSSEIVVTGVYPQDRPNGDAWLKAAVSIGVDALLVFPDNWSSPESARDRFDEIWELTRTPLIVFDLYTKPIPDSTLAELLEHPAVAAFKPARLRDATASERGIRRASTAGRCVLTGEDLMLTESLGWGASGALVGLGAACIELTAAAVSRRAEAGFLSEMQPFIDLLAEATFHEPMDAYVQRMLWIAVDEGLIPPEFGYDPLACDRTGDAERQYVVEAARRARAGVTALLQRRSFG